MRKNRFETDVAGLADVFGISTSRVYALVKAGLPTVSTRPLHFDMRQALAWRLERAQAKAESKAQQHGNPAHQALLRARHEHLELTIAQERAKYVAAEVVDSAFSKFLDVVTRNTAVLAPSMAQTIAATDNPVEVEGLLFERCREIRAAIADDLQAEAARLRA